MKKIILSLLLVLTLIGCSKKELSITTTIVSDNKNVVIIIEDTIYIKENTKVIDVAKNISSTDGSKQKYSGVANDFKPKKSETFNDFEYLMVVAENKKVKKYYKIVIDRENIYFD